MSIAMRFFSGRTPSALQRSNCASKLESPRTIPLGEGGRSIAVWSLDATDGPSLVLTHALIGTICYVTAKGNPPPLPPLPWRTSLCLALPASAATEVLSLCCFNVHHLLSQDFWGHVDTLFIGFHPTSLNPLCIRLARPIRAGSCPFRISINSSSVTDEIGNVSCVLVPSLFSHPLIYLAFVSALDFLFSLFLALISWLAQC